MQFFLHGAMTPQGQAALQKHGHHVHTPAELADESDAAALSSGPAELIKLLIRRQWHLFTTDVAIVHWIYERRPAFPAGIIVLLLEDPAVAGDQAAAIDRLFARYKRLSPRRLYTITPSRVKTRQLPEAPDRTAVRS